MRSERGGKVYMGRQSRRRWGCLLALALFALPRGHAQTSCDYETVTGYGSSNAPIRIDSNHVETYGQSWTSGDVLSLWTPYEETWQQLNGSNITDGAVYDNYPNQTAWGEWTNTLDTAGPGAYGDHSYHWFVPDASCWDESTFYLGYTTGSTLAISRPAISGPSNTVPVSAFWWLGQGVLSDGAYYAQAAWVAQANGASGSPSWSVSTQANGGSVSLSCSPCGSTVATSTSPSSGCVYDITVKLNYGGFESDPFYVAIIQPLTFTLVNGYPINSVYGDGFKSVYQWNLTDTCGSSDPGLSGTEVFGQRQDDTANNWAMAQPAPPIQNDPSSIFQDEIAIQNCGGGCNPVWTNPQAPLSGVTVYHFPWSGYVGSTASGRGLNILTNTTQFYLDHGAHN